MTLVGKREMAQFGRARERSKMHGLMKMLTNAETDRILGAAILGTGGDGIIHSALDMTHADQPYTVTQLAMHTHTTMTELIPTMLGSLGPLT